MNYYEELDKYLIKIGVDENIINHPAFDRLPLIDVINKVIFSLNETLDEKGYAEQFINIINYYGIFKAEDGKLVMEEKFLQGEEKDSSFVQTTYYIDDEDNLVKEDVVKRVAPNPNRENDYMITGAKRTVVISPNEVELSRTELDPSPIIETRVTSKYEQQKKLKTAQFNYNECAQYKLSRNVADIGNMIFEATKLGSTNSVKGTIRLHGERMSQLRLPDGCDLISQLRKYIKNEISENEFIAYRDDPANKHFFVNRSSMTKEELEEYENWILAELNSEKNLPLKDYFMEKAALCDHSFAGKVKTR